MLFTYRSAREIFERALFTGIQAFLAVIVIADSSTIESAAIAGGAAAVAVIQRAIGNRLAETEDA